MATNGLTRTAPNAGASRGRIVAQLVGEATVLAGLGAVVGLTLISVIAAQADTILAQTGASAVIPFWVKIGVSVETVAFLVALTHVDYERPKAVWYTVTRAVQPATLAIQPIVVLKED